MKYAVIDDTGLIENMIVDEPGKSRTPDGKLMVAIRDQDPVDTSWTFSRLRGEFMSVRVVRPLI